MNCTLTNKQQRLLFGKVGIDLKNMPALNFDTYAKDFYDLINSKTKDPVLAANYVSLLPMNIRAVMGANRDIFRKLATIAGRIADLETQFENFDNVQNFIQGFQTEAQDMVNLEKDIQKESLNELPEPVTIIPNTVTTPSISLWDLNFDVTKEGELKPEMALYTNIKQQLIANRKEDGTSVVDGTPVKLQVLSTSEWSAKNFYPDVERDVLAGNQRIIGFNQKGIALAVTDLQGNLVYFDQEVKVNPEGKPAYYIFKAPKKVESGAYQFDFNEQKYVEQIKKQRGVTQAQAEELLNKQNDLFRNIRETVLADPTTKMDVWITGGFTNIVLKPLPQVLTIGNVFDFQGKAFKPYKGPEGKENIYFFDYPGSDQKFVINKPKLPDPIITKLVQLLSGDVVNRNGTPVRTTDKISIFKQFIHIDPAILSLKENAQGGLEVQKLGRTINYPDQKALSDDLMSVLRNNVLTRELSPTQLANKLKNGSQIVTDIKGAPYGSIYQFNDGDKVRSFEIGPLQLKLDKIAVETNRLRDFNLSPREDKLIYTYIERPYYPFIQENFLVDKNQIPRQEKEAGQTLEFALAADPAVQIIKEEVKSEPIAPLFDDKGNLNPEVYEKKTPEKISGINESDMEPVDETKWLLNQTVLFKKIGQQSVEATQEQIKAAKAWYKGNPLSEYFGFEPMFSVINKKGSNNIAEWTTSGITLFKGSDYSDLYHEAWHGFTQSFLTRDDKTNLYNETRKKSDGFIDYVGNKVKFSDATDLQIEEFLAEDFREYMLSDGKKALKTSPVRNSIFRRILNFLKELFGTANVKQTVIDEQITQKVSQLYQKLRVGDLSGYTFAAKNRNYDTLNKALQSIAPQEVEKSLSFEQTNIVYNAVNSLFSKAVDTLNSESTNFNYTTAMFSTQKGIQTLYTYAKMGLQRKLAELTKIENPTNDINSQKELLEYALRNFGDIQNLYENKKDEGVIGYHLYKTDLIEQNVFDEITEDDENAERELSGKEYFDRGGNERSPYDLAAREVTNILKSLYQTDQNGNVINDIFGFPKVLNHKAAFAHILRLLENSKDLPDMYSRLQAESENYHPIKQLLSKMGPVYSPNARAVDLWSKFFQTFNKYRVPLVQTTVNKSVEYDNNGKAIGQPTFDIKIGNALADTNKTDQDWRSQFSKENTNPFIKNDEKGNWLDSKAILETYPDMEKVNSDPMKFLKDIGIIMADIPVVKNELEKDIKSGNIRLSGIYNNITKLNEAGVIIRNIGTYLTSNPRLGVKGLVGQTGPNSNYGKLLALQTKYSSDYSDFMVQNAAGDPQSEYTLNSSLTQIVKQLNSVPSYVELVNNAPTAHYNNAKGTAGKPYNPFINNSIWFNALFDMQGLGGQKRDNELNVDNLSGINSSVNDGVFKEGVALAQSDAIGKLLNDFHVQLMKFTPELTRHAGKKTSLAVYMRNYYTGAKNKRLYIDTEDFVAQDQISSGEEKFQQQLIKYISSELDRVNYAKQLLEDSSVTHTDFNYLKRATKFVAFDGVLSQPTKDKLYAVEGNLIDYLNSDAGIDLDNEIRADILKYFANLVTGVQNRMTDIGFTSQALSDRTRQDAEKLGVNTATLTPENIQRALSASFVANNWIHHFEEMITFYGDIALYKDFFKRNASLNSTGDIIRNDADFIKTVNEQIGRGFTQKLGITMEERPYTGVSQTAILADVLVKSAYYDKYKSAVKSPNIDEKYGEKGVNEADAQGYISFDSYRIYLKGLGKWTLTQEQMYQDLLAGKPASEIETNEMFPTLKMGYYGPIQSDYLPLTGLHKFALFPLIPGVIRSNLQELHEKMMREGIDYVTFESGSKVATITDRSGFQPLYSDQNSRTLSTEPFIKNTIFPEYLKYQVEAAPYYKGKITLATQLRKLADIGLTEEGVPVDFVMDAKFKDRESAWESLNETQKKSASKNYKLRSAYLDSIKDLVENQKNKLLRDIGWKQDKDGTVSGDMSSLLRLISDELKRGDVGDHEWAFIQTIKKNTIKNPLDISTSADMIEKVIISLINKRLINLKVKGEQLVLVSGTAFEDKAFAYQEERNFDKPTQEDLEKYGTNDLPGYYIGENGLIQAAKVKIALQGDFKKLLQHPDVKEKAKTLNISNFQALNLLIKDSDWVNEGDNRYLINMVGARIPTQGPNSGEFVEVYEFLPEIAGNIIIAPSEITSKGGSDFDYDKLPLMMPSIRGTELARKYSKEEAKVLHDKIVAKAIQINQLRTSYGTIRWKSDPAIDNLLKDIFGQAWDQQYTESEINDILQEEGFKTFDDFFEQLNGSAAIENNMIRSLRSILEQPENFEALITPNDTDRVKPYADEIYVAENGKDAKSRDKQGTRMFEPLHNIKVQQANSIGKDTLGIGAIYNTFNAVFNNVGLTLNTNRLLFPHNTKNGNISLSGLKDAEDKNDISEIVSQLINGWVDVEKDDWISYIQGNKEIAPVMLFMLRAGVPIENVVYFVSQPIIKEYVKVQREVKSSFAEALGYSFSDLKGPKRAAKNEVFFKFGLINPSNSDISFLTELLTSGIDNFDLTELKKRVKNEPGLAIKANKIFEAFNKLKEFVENELTQEKVAKLFSEVASNNEAKLIYRKLQVQYHPDKGGDLETAKMINNVYDAYKEGKLSQFNVETKVGKPDNKEVNFDLSVFLHFLEIENLVREVDKVQRAFNVDTTTQLAISDFYEKIEEIKDLREKKVGPVVIKPFIDDKYIDRLIKNSSIGPFYVQDFALNIASRLLPLRSNKILNEKAIDLSPEVKSLFKNDEVAVKTFKDDLLSYIFQNEVRGFEGTEQDDTMEGSIVPEYYFSNNEERRHFNNEKRKLRSQYNIQFAKKDIDYKEIFTENTRKDELKDTFPKELELISYENWLDEKALYNILNPYQLFRSRFGIAGKYAFIVNKYPQLKQNFSLLANIKTSSKDNISNLQLSSLKLNKDEIDIFHENFLDLSNSSKLLEIEGIDQKDADYISQFFGNLPLYLYMQSGPNTRNPFSFNRVMPNNKILRILEEPVKRLTNILDEQYLENYLQAFTLANTNTSTRSRYKDYLAPEIKEEENDSVVVNEEIEEVGNFDIQVVEEEVENQEQTEPTEYSEEQINNLISNCKPK